MSVQDTIVEVPFTAVSMYPRKSLFCLPKFPLGVVETPQRTSFPFPLDTGVLLLPFSMAARLLGN